MEQLNLLSCGLWSNNKFINVQASTGALVQTTNFVRYTINDMLNGVISRNRPNRCLNIFTINDNNVTYNDIAFATSQNYTHLLINLSLDV